MESTYQNLATAVSTNAKLGLGVATTYRPVGNSALGEGTCPPSCPLLNNGCYAQKGRANLQNLNSKKRYDSLEKLLTKGARYVRLHTSGDFFKSDGESGHMLDLIYFTDVINIVKANPKITFWTYTHDISKLVEAGFSYAMGTIPSNLHITASCDLPEHIDVAHDNGFRAARVIEAISDKNKNETFCPYDLHKHQKKESMISCANCQLCFNPKHKKDIAFLKH